MDDTRLGNPVPAGLTVRRTPACTRIVIPIAGSAGCGILVALLIGIIVTVLSGIALLVDSSQDRDTSPVPYILLIAGLIFLVPGLLGLLSRSTITLYPDRIVRRGRFGSPLGTAVIARDTIRSILVRETQIDATDWYTRLEIYVVSVDDIQILLTNEVLNLEHARFIKREIEAVLNK